MAATRPTLLVVDDDEDVREVLTLLLDEQGFDVVTAEHGRRALDKLEAGLWPKVIILDLMMPVMNGWQFWDWQQAHPAMKNIPVLILTAIGLRTGALGRAVILPKPIDAPVLLSAIQAHAAPASP